MYSLSYRKIAKHLYAVYCKDCFIGEVCWLRGSWRFRTFYDPAFVTALPAPTRFLAVAQWPGLVVFSL